MSNSEDSEDMVVFTMLGAVFTVVAGVVLSATCDAGRGQVEWQVRKGAVMVGDSLYYCGRAAVPEERDSGRLRAGEER